MVDAEKQYNSVNKARSNWFTAITVALLVCACYPNIATISDWLGLLSNTKDGATQVFISNAISISSVTVIAAALATRIGKYQYAGSNSLIALFITILMLSSASIGSTHSGSGISFYEIEFVGVGLCATLFMQVICHRFAAKSKNIQKKEYIASLGTLIVGVWCVFTYMFLKQYRPLLVVSPNESIYVVLGVALPLLSGFASWKMSSVYSTC